MSEQESMKGTYLLYLELKKPQEIEIGRLGLIEFKKGFYLYIGSAKNGIIQRVSRHLKDEKKLFWHIDYFLSNNNSSVEKVYYTEEQQYSECDVSRMLLREFDDSLIPVDCFGCSDCSCKSHFYYIYRDFRIGEFSFNSP